jgi:hypothetical protein
LLLNLGRRLISYLLSVAHINFLSFKFVEKLSNYSSGLCLRPH